MRIERNTPDLWDTLAHADRPIAVYGMGNGADKLIDRLNAFGSPVACVCASDEFVRGQSFRGFRVMKLSEVKECFGRAFLLLAFGSRLPEVIDRVRALSSDFEVRIPDMPVTDTEFFDRAFYAAHEAELRRALDLFADTLSKELFSSLVRYKLSGDVETLMSYTSSKEEIYALIGDGVTHMLDLGAYRGDTAEEAIRHFPKLRHVTAVEPDRRSFKKLSAFAEGCTDRTVDAHLAAVGAQDGEAVFYGSGNRNASLGATSHAYREDTVPMVTVDTLMHGKTVNYIKYDVEGAEADALRGSFETLRRERPILRVAVYHKSEDLYRIPLMIAEKFSDYRFYLRRTPCFPAWEADLICIPKER